MLRDAVGWVESSRPTDSLRLLGNVKPIGGSRRLDPPYGPWNEKAREPRALAGGAGDGFGLPAVALAVPFAVAGVVPVIGSIIRPIVLVRTSDRRGRRADRSRAVNREGRGHRNRSVAAVARH